MLLILIWILVTLSIVSIIVLLSKKYGFELISVILASLVVISNILANKIVLFGSFIVSAGVIAYSITFMLTNILAELYGKKVAKRAVFFGFCANIILVLTIYIAILWKPAPFALETSEMFAKVLGLTPRIVLASLIAYLISHYFDIYFYLFWKKVTKDKFLWLRNNFSTILSQLIDSIFFISIAFYGIAPLIPLITGQFIIKVIISILSTPFIYLIIRKN
ncbi:queuosine precursor transporter [Candidatus Woesearchaeota archaeon]|nr:queuosine precursor transporter [Candidatus Woesearchaeota archaeon]